ncbi:MAG: hypothetical protein WBQ18_04130 [Solirubrobacteraceae bacterium]|jgi:hypothetical protein
MGLSGYFHAHGRTAAVIRCAVGVWLLALCAYLLARGVWLGLLFLVPAGVHFYLAYRAVRNLNER